MGFAGAYSFKYSPRPGTPGGAMPGQVPEDVKTERLACAAGAGGSAAQGFNPGTVGARSTCWSRSRAAMPGQLVGKSPYLQAVHFEAPAPLIGDDRRRSGSRGRAPTAWSASVVGAGAAACRLMPHKGEAHLRPSEVRRAFTGAARTAWRESAEIKLTFDDNRLASLVFGQYDQNIALIERRLGVVANANGNHVIIKGPPKRTEQARRVLEHAL